MIAWLNDCPKDSFGGWCRRDGWMSAAAEYDITLVIIGRDSVDAELGKYLEKNKNINRGYRELEVWREDIELFAIVRNRLKIQTDISFKIRAQIEDSILSVSSNIAEGYCRRSLKENIQFNAIALASLGENYSQTFALSNSNDIDLELFNEYDKKHYSLENKLVKLNKVFISKLKTKDEWKNDYVISEMIESYGCLYIHPYSHSIIHFKLSFFFIELR